MNIYLEEVAASTFMSDIGSEARTMILMAMESFPLVLQLSVQFSDYQFPEKTWNLLFKQQGLGAAMTGPDGSDGSKRPSKR